MSSRAVQILRRPEVKPYWQAMAKIRRAYEVKLRRDRDVAVLYALDALDEVEAIPRKLDDLADRKNKVDGETSA